MKLNTTAHKTLALTALMIIASPVHAFLDVKALWNSFNQNTGAQIAVGAACTAAVASLGWMFYKRHSKPMPQAKAAPSITSFHSAKGPQKDARWNRNTAPAPQQLTWGQLANHYGIVLQKKPAYARKVTDPNTTILQETNGAPVTVPLSVIVNAPEGIIIAADKVDGKHLSEQQVKAITAYQSRVHSKANSAAKETISGLLHKVEQEASRKENAQAKIERDNQKLDKLAEEASKQAFTSAKREYLLDFAAEQTLIDATEKAVFELCQEASGKKAACFISNKTRFLLSLEKQLQEKEYSEDHLDKIMCMLNGTREELFSFYSKGENLNELYQANFKKIAHLIKPKEAYQALADWKVLSEEQVRDKAAKVPTATIHKYLNELMEKTAHNSDAQFVYRQLDYIFRNEITRDKYNNWLDGLPPVTLDTEVLTDLAQLHGRVQLAALEKREKLKPKKSPQKQKSEKEDKKSDQERYKKATEQFKKAASATASAASNATSVAYSAVASAAQVVFAAGARLFTLTSSPTQEDKQQPTSSSAQASADAKAMADKTADKPAQQPTPVDPLSAAPYSENHLQAGPAQAPVVINAGPSIALVVTPSAAAAPAEAAGKSTESLQAEHQQGDALGDSYDMLQSTEDLTHGGIVRVAQPMPRPSGASGGASA